MTDYIIDVPTIILLSTLFAILHSWPASLHFKKRLEKKYPGILSFNTLIDNLIALFSFYLVYELIPKPGAVIYGRQYPLDMFKLIPQFAAFGAILWIASYFDLLKLLVQHKYYGFSAKYIKSRNVTSKLHKE